MESRGQTDLSSFLGRGLFLDLQAKEDHIYRIGAVYGQATFERKGPFDVAQALAQLDAFSQDAEVILGHNLLTMRCEIEEPLLSAVLATEALLTTLQIPHAFVVEAALAAWLSRPAAAGSVDVLALLTPDRSCQVPMMASNRGFVVDEKDLEETRELDLIPMRYAHERGNPRVHVLMASNALYSRMLKRTMEAEIGDDMIPVAHAEDLGLMLAMQDARETLDALIEAAGDRFDVDRFNETLVSIGVPGRMLAR